MWDEARFVVGILALLLTGALIPMVNRALTILREIRTTANALNGRLYTLETWRTDHKEWDEAAHAGLQRQIDRDRPMGHRE